MKKFLRVEKSAALCLERCRWKGFSFDPGHMVGRDENGLWAYSGLYTNGSYRVYRLSRGHWYPSWEDQSDGAAVSSIIRSGKQRQKLAVLQEIASQRTSADRPKHIEPWDGFGDIQVVHVDVIDTDPHPGSGCIAAPDSYRLPAGSLDLLVNGKPVEVDYQDKGHSAIAWSERWRVRLPSEGLELTWDQGFRRGLSSECSSHAEMCLAYLCQIMNVSPTEFLTEVRDAAHRSHFDIM